jgi:hypothetical protein
MTSSFNFINLHRDILILLLKKKDLSSDYFFKINI